MRKGYKQTDVGIYPIDWEIRTIGATMRLINGRAFKPQDWKDRGLPIIRIQNLNDPNATFNYCDDPVEDKHIINDGDLLFAWSGTKGTSFGARVWRGGMGVLNQHIFKVIPDQQKLTKAYSYLILRMVQEQIEKEAHGFKASFVHVKKTDLGNVLLPLPPTLAEQEAIAEALSDTDALIESLETLLAKKRQVKQGAMSELLTGKRRVVESGEWKEKRLGELASFYKGKGLPKSALDPSGKESCIHYGELFTQYPEIIQNIISRTNVSENSFRSCANDVLMPTSDVTPNGLAKASCIMSDGVILGGDILVIRPIDKLVFGSFLSYVIRYSQEQILQLVTGTTVFHLYASDMKNFIFSLPTVAEQTAIAEILSDMDAEIRAVEEKLSKACGVKAGMMSQLLTGRVRLV